MMNAMTQITTNIMIPKNTKLTTAGTANSSNEKKKFYVQINILTCYYSGITSSITVFNKWASISSTEI